MTERFVVGTGRCGSTLLSRMLATHRDVVSIHEFFTGLDWAKRFVPEVVDVGYLLDLISGEQPVTTDVLARGYTSDEIQYPFGAEDVRFQPGDPMPWLLVSMLPRLTDRPDMLYDAMLSFAGKLEPAVLSDHYGRLFDWLTEAAGGRLWVERSGSSVDYLTELHALYPDARFVHIHRNGPEAALSIRDHPFYRLAVSLLFDALLDDDDEDAVIRHAIETPPPVESVGQYWSDQVLNGYKALPALAPGQYLEVRFEDLVTEPEPVLQSIATFLEFPHDQAFVAEASAMVRGVPARRFEVLGADEQNKLAAACRPGQILLGQIDG